MRKHETEIVNEKSEGSFIAFTNDAYLINLIEGSISHKTYLLASLSPRKDFVKQFIGGQRTLSL